MRHSPIATVACSITLVTFLAFNCRLLAHALVAEGATSAAPTSLLSVAKQSHFENLRSQLERMRSVAQASKDPRIHQRLAKLEWFWKLSIVDATERHRMIRSLPVQIIEEDGVKRFVSRGKIRVQVPSESRLGHKSPTATVTPDLPELPDGSTGAPLASDDCESESEVGPCATETGTVTAFVPEKPDGSTGVRLASEDCEWENEIGPCATEQEKDDALILYAELEAEAAGYANDISEAEAEYEAYCNQWGCEGDVAVDEAELPSSGPSVTEASVYGPCGQAVASAAFNLAGAALSRWALYTVAAATITTGGLALIVAAAIISTGSLAFSAADVIQNCTPPPIFELLVSEAVYLPAELV